MKKIIVLFMLSMTLFQTAFAVDQGVLDALIKQGMQVRMGELTGAGSRFSVNNLAGLILNEGVLMKEDCSAIVVKSGADPKISDIIKIKINNQEIASSEFIGFVVK